MQDADLLKEKGSEGGVIVRDETYEALARITLEKETLHAPFVITCGVYGLAN